MLQQYKMVQQGEISMAISAENTYDFQKDPKASNPVEVYPVDNTCISLKSRITPNTKITISNPNTTAVVIRPFTITVEHSETEDEYMATSSIFNGFELEATPSQARESYLRSLVDDLIWLQKHKEELSPSILKELHLLEHYIQIVQ
jgi:hypothetical protein